MSFLYLGPISSSSLSFKATISTDSKLPVPPQLNFVLITPTPPVFYPMAARTFSPLPLPLCWNTLTRTPTSPPSLEFFPVKSPSSVLEPTSATSERIFASHRTARTFLTSHPLKGLAFDSPGLFFLGCPLSFFLEGDFFYFPISYLF